MIERGCVTRPAIGGWNITERATDEPAMAGPDEAR
ncbi:hypothetical protein BO443_160167 [Burkholderia orbicola]